VLVGEGRGRLQRALVAKSWKEGTLALRVRTAEHKTVERQLQKSLNTKRSVVIGRCKTSVSLEDAFWGVSLAAACRQRSVYLSSTTTAPRSINRSLDPRLRHTFCYKRRHRGLYHHR
jgi:hypothetical protein